MTARVNAVALLRAKGHIAADAALEKPVVAGSSGGRATVSSALPKLPA
jgi:hypothetical protein